jgi:hypothetical protein
MRARDVPGGRLRSIMIGFSVVMAACSLPSTTPTASRAAPEPRATRSAALSPAPSPTPIPLPSLDLATDQTWFGPNMGSVDFPELFSQSERWATARDAVDAFAFYANSVSGDPYDIGGDNILDTFVAVDAFARLQEWGIPIVIEAGVVKFFACDHASWAEYASRAIANVESNGGRVGMVAMDEPLLGGQIVENEMGCGQTLQQTATEVAEFVDDVTSDYPEVRIGDVEPYPHLSADVLLAWLDALAEAGASPAFFHLDVDMERVAVEGHDVAGDLARLAAGSSAAGVPFGVIFTSNWTEAGTDAGLRRLDARVGDGGPGCDRTAGARGRAELARPRAQRAPRGADQPAGCGRGHQPHAAASRCPRPARAVAVSRRGAPRAAGRRRALMLRAAGSRSPAPRPRRPARH